MDYISKHNITGRGLVFVVKKGTSVALNDLVIFDNIPYVVTGIEMLRDLLFGDPIGDIGLLVRPGVVNCFDIKK